MTNTTPAKTAERFWSAHLDAIERDGVSVAEYARVHSLSAPSLYAWRSRLARRRPKRAHEPSLRFAELVATPTTPASVPAPTATAALSMTLGSVRVEFDALPDVAWLAALVAAVEPSR